MQTQERAEGAARPERNIFQYFNGTRQVYADPLTIHRGIITVFDGDPNAVLKATKSEDKLGTAYPATIKLLKGLREVFKMPEISPETGEGATEGDCFAALDEFIDWQEKKRTNGGTSPTSPPPSASSPAPAPTSA